MAYSTTKAMARGEWRKYRGGSNGQSSLLQFFDAILGVKHDRSAGFSTEMRKYMPGPHSRFLYDIESIANIRDYVDSHQNNVALLNAYNDASRKLEWVSRQAHPACHQVHHLAEQDGEAGSVARSRRFSHLLHNSWRPAKPRSRSWSELVAQS